MRRADSQIKVLLSVDCRSANTDVCVRTGGGGAVGGGVHRALYPGAAGGGGAVGVVHPVQRPPGPGGGSAAGPDRSAGPGRRRRLRCGGESASANQLLSSPSKHHFTTNRLCRGQV